MSAHGYLPWWTKAEQRRLAKELNYLKVNLYDQKADAYRDIRWMYFRGQVLDEYRNNDLCSIGSEHISFLSLSSFSEEEAEEEEENKKEPESISTVNFISRTFPNIYGSVIMVQAQDYIFIPPRQRSHWQQYEIPENQILPSLETDR